jgi:hypothetical protein
MEVQPWSDPLFAAHNRQHPCMDDGIRNSQKSKLRSTSAITPSYGRPKSVRRTSVWSLLAGSDIDNHLTSSCYLHVSPKLEGYRWAVCNTGSFLFFYGQLLVPVNCTPFSPSKIQNNVNASWENYSGKIYEDEICKETRDSNRAIRNWTNVL